MDCNPSPDATEEECVAKGCCWQAMQTSSPDFPWCFFPGSSRTCMDGQAAKDADKTVKDAAAAYHAHGSEATVTAYNKACVARGDNFCAFYATPLIKQSDNSWKNTAVTLVKYGCNAAACGAKDMKNVIHTIESRWTENFKLNVTSYSCSVTPPTITVNGGGSSTTGIVLTTLGVCGILVALAGVMFIWYRRHSDNHAQLNMASDAYAAHKRDSFPVPESLKSTTGYQPTSVVKVVGETPSTDDAKASLVNSGM